MMRTLITPLLAVAILLGSTGCRADISDARRDHMLAGPHGWIDLSFKSAPRVEAYQRDKQCLIELKLNQQEQLTDTLALAEAGRQAAPPGFRFVAPAGKAEAALTLSGCVPQPQVLRLPLDVGKDQLLHLVYDGSALALESSVPFEPTTLEWLHEEVLKLHASNNASTDAVGKLTQIAFASLALNVLALLILVLVLWKRRHKAV
ncbi:MAG: hypothetical protein ACJ8GW_08245 [Massilia sp.]